MKNKKLAAIPLIIAITLSIAGIAYAAWYDYAYISGTVYMGSLTLAFSTYEPPECTERHFNPTPPPERLDGEAEGKDVGNCSAHYEKTSLITDPHTGKQGYKILVINITNAYPQYIVHTTFMVHNIGTVPLVIYGLNLTGVKQNATGTTIYNLVMNTSIVGGDLYGDIWEDVDGSGTVTPGDILVINLIIKNGSIPYQLDPCNDDKWEMDLDFKQEAEECHTYILHFRLLSIQWNKLSEVYP